MAPFQIVRFLGFLFLFAHYSQAGLVSTPFDNFHIECPQNAGVQRLSVRMVESQGMKRQDTVFSISCNNVKELYSWNGIPSELAAIDREECRYSAAFDPIMDTTSELSCGPREYIASVVRLYGTKIQVGCCKLRTREETNCVVQRFGKPFGLNVRSEIENRGMLLNSIAVDGNYIRARFCELTPRAAGLIVEDAKKDAAKKTTTISSTTSEQTSPTTTTIAIQTTQPVVQTSETTETTALPKRVIKVKPQKTQNENTSEKQAINLPTILQPQQPVDNIDTNQIAGAQRSLHGTSIVDGTAGHKAKDAPQGLAKIVSNDSTPSKSTTEVVESTTEIVQQTSTVEATTESTQTVSTTDKEEPASSTKTVVEEQATSTPPVEQTSQQQEITSSLPEIDSTTNSPTPVVNTEQMKTETEPQTTIAETIAQTTTSKIEETTPEILTTTSVKLEESETSTIESSTQALTSESVKSTIPAEKPLEELATSKEPEVSSSTLIQESTSTEPSISSEEPTTATTQESTSTKSEVHIEAVIQTIEKTSTEVKSTTQELPKLEQPHPQFVATDSRDTETMFPKMPNGDDYDDEENPKDEAAKAEADKIMKSIMEMMDTRQEIKKLTEELKTTDDQPQSTLPTTISEESPTTPESSVLIVARKDKKPTNEGQTKMDSDKPETRVDFVQADQEPLAVENVNGEQKKLNEFVDRAPFDFSAFPQPKDSVPAKEVAELPRYTRVQAKTTSKPRLPLATTTKEPDYLVADRLDDIPNPIRLKPRRNFVRTSELRRRPISQFPDEETNSSPFDENAESRSTGRQRKTDSGFADENAGSRHDLFDQEGSFEQPSEGRFSLPTDSRFGQRSPFEVRRAPVPHLKEPYYSFDAFAEKYALKSTQRPQSVDILFESIAEEVPSTTAQTSPSSISHRDAERYFRPPNNQPMKAPEPSMFANDDHPKKLTFLYKKQRDPTKNKKPLPDASNQLVPMSEVPLPTVTVSSAEPIVRTTEPTTQLKVETAPAEPSTTQYITTTMEQTTPQSTTEIPVESTQNPEPTTIVTMQDTEPLVEQTPEPSTKIYNPVDFYHTLPPRRQYFREKILTFCSKDTAIRDENHMVIACGVESEVWQPARCPEGTDCFTSSDSNYRICCPVGSK